MSVVDKARFALLWLWVKFKAFVGGLFTLASVQLLVRLAMTFAAGPLITHGRATGADLEAAIGVVLLAIAAAWQAQVESAKAKQVPAHATEKIERLEGELAEAKGPRRVVVNITGVIGDAEAVAEQVRKAIDGSKGRKWKEKG
jgi:hypothetical protein